MTAIISVIMIGLGFINGMIVAQVLDWSDVNVLHKKLNSLTDIRNRLQRTIDDLEDDLDDERREKEKILKRIEFILSDYRNLPRPEGPLTRSQAVSETDSEDEDFPNPASPEPAVNSKD